MVVCPVASDMIETLAKLMCSSASLVNGMVRYESG